LDGSSKEGFDEQLSTIFAGTVKHGADKSRIFIAALQVDEPALSEALSVTIRAPVCEQLNEKLFVKAPPSTEIWYCTLPGQLSVELPTAAADKATVPGSDGGTQSVGLSVSAAGIRLQSATGAWASATVTTEVQEEVLPPASETVSVMVWGVPTWLQLKLYGPETKEKKQLSEDPLSMSAA
jgi:hypothetical protein